MRSPRRRGTRRSATTPSMRTYPHPLHRIVRCFVHASAAAKTSSRYDKRNFTAENDAVMPMLSPGVECGREAVTRIRP